MTDDRGRKTDDGLLNSKIDNVAFSEKFEVVGLS